MEHGIVANATLDFIEFQAFPSQNRYEACIYLGKKRESVTSGPLTQLLRHSDKVKSLHSNGSVANIKLERPGNLGISKWFSKSSLQRFLHFIASSNGLNSTNAMLNEISQLEEARRFHISLYTKGSNPDGQTEANASTLEVETNSTVSDASKNELVRAMDLRLTALRGELAAAVHKAAGGTCSSEDIVDLMKLSNYLGSSELGKTLRKFIEMFHREQIVDLANGEQSVSAKNSGDHGIGSMKEDYQIAKPAQSDTPVKYGVSPAKAAQAERQGSSESDESSSEDDLPIAERSRTPIRCPSPRRSASPMRRVQIGRTGSRRATPLTIKSLPYIAARERVFSHKETGSNSSDDEQPRKPEKNITRLSVQDAVKLFENKQKEQTVDSQKDKSLSNAVTGANKSVLRRWSSGAGENSKSPSDIASESVPTGPSTLVDEEEVTNSSEAKPESKAASNCYSDEPSKVNVDVNSPGRIVSSTDDIEEVAQPIVTTGTSERLTSSAEWGRQKEAELNQLLMKMMETRPTKYQSVPESGKKKKIPSDGSKEKRDPKLRGATTGKRAEKEKQSSIQQRLDEKRSAVAPKISSATGGHENAKKPQKPLNNVAQSAKPKEAPKPAAIKRSTQKSSSLPAVRKSWPSAPSPRSTVSNSATTIGSVPLPGATTARRKSQPTPSAPLPSPKADGPQLRQKPVKASQVDPKKNTKSVSERNLQAKVKSGKITKPIKPKSAVVDPPPSAKPSLYSKVTKKSSVVPLESKPFLKKGSGIGSAVVATVKAKSSPQPEIAVRKSGDDIPTKENDLVLDCPSIAIEQAESNVECMQGRADTGSEMVTERPQVCEEQEIPDRIKPEKDDASERIVGSPLMSDDAEEETVISAAAWVEIEEQDHQSNQCIGGSISQIESANNSVQVKMPSPRVRHSLSQMLLEEINEPQVIEWGNAENPPSMIYQKDAPKGFKRLLKFARKSKTDASSSGFSSPSVFSEGEDDTEDSKAANKRSAENLLKKATLRSLEAYEDNPASLEFSDKKHTSNNSSQTLFQKMREGHAPAPVTSTKASKSFFSLSAFKGGN